MLFETITHKEMLGIFQARIIDLEKYDISEAKIDAIGDEKIRAKYRVSNITLKLNKRLLAIYGDGGTKLS